MGDKDVTGLVLITTLIFSLALVFILFYIISYNERKRRHQEEKIQMKQTFDMEITKAELEVMEHTMQTIGTDLHDNIGQLLSLTAFTLNSIDADNTEKTREKVDSAINLTKKSIREMRQLGKLLQGEQILSQGLCTAIEYEVDWLEKSGQFHVCYEVHGDFHLYKNEQKDLILFRILQEILNNIVKHSQGTLIELFLEKKDGTLKLVIADNGIGFTVDHDNMGNTGMGLKNIGKRANMVGGKAKIESIIGTGTTITIEIPYI